MNRATSRKVVAVRCARACAGLALMVVAVGCTTVPVEYGEPPPDFWLAVLDLRVPDEWRDPDMPDKVSKHLEGWWFSSRDVWHNPGLGRVASDAFSRELSHLDFIHRVSPVDVKYYMAEKREQLRRALSERRRKLEESADPADREEAERIHNLSEADYDRMLERLPAREIGRELRVERVLTGRIHNAYLAHNRTISWHWSYVDLEVDLVDVDTGNIVWHKRAQFKKHLVYPEILLEIAARNMVEMMKREYFFQP